VNTYLLYSRHFSLFLLGFLLFLLPGFVQSSDESLRIPLVTKAILVLLPGRCIVCDVYLAVSAEIFLVGDPILAHGQMEVGRDQLTRSLTRSSSQTLVTS
jgi:hypothetical protein